MQHKATNESRERLTSADPKQSSFIRFDSGSGHPGRMLQTASSLAMIEVLSESCGESEEPVADVPGRAAISARSAAVSERL
jgi:hypothetical protein